jgi:purine-binding chemotaxis protein CheW
VRHVVFLVGKDRYALPLDAVREVVVAPDRFTRVPHAGAAVKGVMTLRGRVVPVADLGKLLTGTAVQQTSTGRIVLLELSRRDLGLLVSDVVGIEPIEGVERVGAHTSRLVRGLAQVHDSPVTVLELQPLDAAVAGAFANPLIEKPI